MTGERAVHNTLSARIGIGLVVGALGLLVVGPLVFFTTGYRIDIARFAFYVAALAVTWSFLAGVAGQFSFAHVAIAGLAAYAGAIWTLALRTSVPVLGNVWIAIVVGTLFAALLGMLLGLLLGRLRGPYLALFTIAFAEIGRRVIVAESEITGGRNSLVVPLLPGDARAHYYLMLAVLLGIVVLLTWLLGTRFGLFLRAMREDEDAACALGVGVLWLKVAAFALASALAGLTATIFFSTTGRISPEDLDLFLMSQVIAFAVIGGVESPLAAGAAAIVMSLLLESLRTIAIGPLHVDTGVWRLAVFGALLMLAVRFARNGLLLPLFECLGGRAAEVRRSAEARFAGASERGVAAELPVLSSRPGGAPPIDLRIEDLRFGFGGNAVLRGIDIVIDRPQICALIGPNGAGKSTLVNVLTGMYRPDGGAIVVHGERVEGLSPDAIARRGIGRTFQVTRPLRRMTVGENLAVPLCAADPALSADAIAVRARELLRWLGMGHLEREYSRALSGGQQKLLELARLVMRDPSILILDEPLAGVHPNLRTVIADFVRALRARGKAIVIIEHDIEALFAMSERIIVLADGGVIADGHPDEVRRDPAVIAAYLGVPDTAAVP